MKMIQTESKDGDVIDLQPKSLGTTELYPNVNSILKIKNFKKKNLKKAKFKLNKIQQRNL